MDASATVTFGIAGLALTVALLFVWAFGVARGRLGGSSLTASLEGGLGAAAWMAIFGGIAATGWLARTDLRPPPGLLIFVGTFGLGLALGLGRVGDTFARGLPLSWLVAAQCFRLPLELVMHEAAREGTMPLEMSFSGYNFDIITGASAVIVAGVLAIGRAPRGLVFAWNVLGCVLLFCIALIAFLSTPMVHAFGTDPSHLNTWVTHFPFVWLPSVMVAFALFGHIVVFRALLGSNTR